MVQALLARYLRLQKAEVSVRRPRLPGFFMSRERWPELRDRWARFYPTPHPPGARNRGYYSPISGDIVGYQLRQAQRTAPTVSQPLDFIEIILERAKRFELSTPTLARLCSTTELRPRSVNGVRTPLERGRLIEERPGLGKGEIVARPPTAGTSASRALSGRRRR